MLRLNDVSYSYDKKTFINHMNLTVKSGKITALIGRNGCGKSTVLKLCTRLLTPDEGQVYLDGIPVETMNPKVFARNVSVLLQNSEIPDMTVEQAVLSARFPYWSPFGGPSTEDRDRMEDALTASGCLSLRYQNMYRVSGGERQRAYLAMILAQNTPYLFLDEPTTYLDLNVSHEMIKQIYELNRKFGKTVVMVLHDINLALNYTDYILLLEKGSVAAYKPTADPQLLRRISDLFQINIKDLSENNRKTYFFTLKYEETNPCKNY
ncbi:ABC transporter ATP-binding protein [Clostridium sp. E02]|uniref:ABC transporter ATP-binding protein n=1 Tax=Clostridium sp. E02 TaxID=2487134 RepID=UPI000F51DAD7|nr:ABC transporter ATP-binding protein [Clostridium sp. E02]